MGISRLEAASLERALQDRSLEFTAAYMAACELHALVRKHPPITSPETVWALQALLEGREHLKQKQALFLYREAAGNLCSVASLAGIEENVAEHAVAALRRVLSRAKGRPRQAAAEAMGSLPLCLNGPRNLGDVPPCNTPCLEWEEILERCPGVCTATKPSVVGRSLILPLADTDELLVVKLASTGGSLDAMGKEAAWMDHLGSNGCSFPVRFDVPRPLALDGGGYVFRLKSLPSECGGHVKVHPDLYAIGFIAHKDYFLYINSRSRATGLCLDTFKEAVFRNAWLFGNLAASGIVHTAPIPLFHNRVQRERRPDLGLYEWPRGGRLDRWLHSCAYPNFGLTGLRDFEHFLSIQDSDPKLYQHIGSHILSLLLVAASYFRNQEPERVGLDGDGKPVDARDLFDRNVLGELVEGIVSHYYRGFVGRDLAEELPVRLDEIASRMREEMGVDRYMEEILRAVDQSRMSEEEFQEFLRERGYPAESIQGLRRGAADITVLTGPHLGAFNNRISLPELTELLETVSALCIAGRYMTEKFNRFTLATSRAGVELPG